MYGENRYSIFSNKHPSHNNTPVLRMTFYLIKPLSPGRGQGHHDRYVAHTMYGENRYRIFSNKHPSHIRTPVLTMSFYQINSLPAGWGRGH